MDQWSHIVLEAAIGLISFAVLWGSVREQIRTMKDKIKALEASAQTPSEREAFRSMVDRQLESHERLDDERFQALHRTLEDKLDVILKAIVNSNGVRGQR